MKWLLRATHRIAFRLLAPASLRSLFEEEVLELFADLLEQAEPTGRRAMVRIWLRELVQLVTTVQHLSRTTDPRRVRRTVRGGRWAVARELRAAGVALTRRPAHAVSVVGTLAVGIGLSLAVHSVARVSVLAPLPVSEPDRTIVTTGLVERDSWQIRTAVTSRELAEVAATAGSLERYASFTLGTNVTVETPRHPVTFRVRFVGADYFGILGLQAAHGRPLTPADPEDSVVLAHHAWVRVFGADPSVIGRRVVVAGIPVTVVGVLDERAWGLSHGPEETDAWLPERMGARMIHRDLLTSLTRGAFWGVGRLREGVTRPEADRELRRAHADFAADHPLPDDRTLSAIDLREYFFAGMRRPFAAVSFGAVLVLLIAAVNTGFLMALRARDRRNELALRRALGAGWPDTLVTLLAEALLLGLLGGLAAAVVGTGALTWFTAGPGGGILRFDEYGIGPLTWAVALLLAWVITGAGAVLGFCTVGADGRPTDPPGRIRGVRRLADLVIGVEATVTTVVIVALALGARSLGELRAVELGYSPEGLGSARVNLTGSAWSGPDGARRFARALVGRAEDSPIRIGAMGPDMMSRSLTHVHMTPAGLDPDAEANISRVPWISVAPGTLRTLGIEVIEGRAPAPDDVADGRRVVVLSRSLAERFWPGRSPIGERVHLNHAPVADLTVVGVAEDVRHNSRYAEPYTTGAAYFPFEQRPTERVSLLYREVGGGPVSRAAIEAAVRAVAPDVALYDVAPMSRRLGGEEWALRTVVLLLGTYGAIAVCLCLCGIVSLVATTMEDQRREIAIRGALGAGRGRLSRDQTRGLLRPLLGGVLLGSVLATGATRALASVLYGVSLVDPSIHLLVATLVVSSGLVAGWIPAWRSAARAPRDVLAT